MNRSILTTERSTEPAGSLSTSSTLYISLTGTTTLASNICVCMCTAVKQQQELKRALGEQAETSSGSHTPWLAIVQESPAAHFSLDMVPAAWAGAPEVLHIHESCHQHWTIEENLL